MLTYPIPMVPGPVRVPQAVLEAYGVDYGSGDLEAEFLERYCRCEAKLQTLLQTHNRVVIQSGEGMIALWSALKSCLVSGDRVLALATGLFGEGIGEMASNVGAEVKTVSFGFEETLSDWDRIEEAIVSFAPKMITAVHCETPSGTLNPLAELGKMKERHGVPLLYVDAVSSIGGTPVPVDAWHIDLCLGGSQKCLSSIPDTAFVCVSEAAWEAVDAVGYTGYDALKPFREVHRTGYFPYTPNWHGTAGLDVGAQLILDEGLEASYRRHEACARRCRQLLLDAGIELFPAEGAVPSPTVTAARLPASLNWEDFDGACRKQGLVLGGNYGPLAGKIFRLGHMGSQADPELVERAVAVIRSVLENAEG
ncbi:MAG: aminotransferase class V-fold PLP-dependent enzyme [Desulfobacteraceae bacterium]|nr:aminotransferase class V-fold PLP-dependent enzyme [Desulfobacteraceae bacterium]